MKKDYLAWHLKKSRTQEMSQRPFFHELEIWFTHLGTNIGYEQDGVGNDFLRPVLIIKKFNQFIFWGIPLTKTVKKESPYYFNFSFTAKEKSAAILSQIRLIDAKRLSHIMGKITKEDFQSLIKKFKELLP